MKPQHSILVDARALQAGFKEHKTRGIGHYASNLIRVLAHYNIRLTYLQEKGLPSDELISSKPTLWHRPPFRSSKVLRQLAEPSVLARRISLQPFDLVHYLSHQDASPQTRCPFVVSVMDTITLSVNELYSPAQRIKYRAMQQFINRPIIHRASLVLAISECTKKDIVRYYQVAPGKVVVVPLAVEERFFSEWSPSDIANLRSRYDLPDSFILYVGGIDPRKNVGSIFAAMRILLSAGKPCPPLVFAGHIKNQREYPEMMKHLRELGIEHHIRFLGFVPDEDLPLLFKTSVAFVYPSRYEGFGLPILQAMAAGTPVLTTKLSSIPEVAGSAALYIDPDDPATIAENLTALLAASDLRNSLVAKGNQQARGFSWERTGAKTVEAYDEILRRTSFPRSR